MIPKQCSFCRGKLYKSKTDFVVKIKNEIVSINNIPAYICDNCDESYFDADTSKKIDKIMELYHSGNFLAHPIAAGEIEFDMEVA